MTAPLARSPLMEGAISAVDPIPYADSAEHILDELKRLDLILLRALRLQRGHPGLRTAADVRGLVIGEAEIDSLVAGMNLIDERWLRQSAMNASLGILDREIDARLTGIEGRRKISEAKGVFLALPVLARQFDLVVAEVDILLLALAPELDQVYETVYAYLQDDVTRRRPSVGLGVQLICRTAREALDARRLFEPDGALVGRGLIELGEDVTERSMPLLRRWMKLDDAVTSYLLGPPLRWVPGGAELVSTDRGNHTRELEASSRARVEACAAFLKQREPRNVVVEFSGLTDAVRQAGAELFARCMGRNLLMIDGRALAASPGRMTALCREAVLTRSLPAIRFRGELADHDPAEVTPGTRPIVARVQRFAGAAAAHWHAGHAAAHLREALAHRRRDARLCCTQGELGCHRASRRGRVGYGAPRGCIRVRRASDRSARRNGVWPCGGTGRDNGHTSLR